MEPIDLWPNDRHAGTAVTDAQPVSKRQTCGKRLSCCNQELCTHRLCELHGAQRWSTDVWPLPRSPSDSILNQALSLYLSDTIIPDSDSLCTGHFTRLARAAESALPGDVLPVALQAVALASLANRRSNVNLQTEATRRYLLAIHRLRLLNLKRVSGSYNLIASIVLLGIYEIINARIGSESNWLRHVHGMLAVLKDLVQHRKVPATGLVELILGSETPIKVHGEQDSIKNSSCSSSAQIQRLSKEHNYFTSYLAARVAVGSPMPEFDVLCAILPQVQSLFQRSAPMLRPGNIRYEALLKQYQEEAVALKARLYSWSSALPESCGGKIIQRFTGYYELCFPDAENCLCPILRADAYSDHFLACMWNTYRQCQLHLTDLLARINTSLSHDPDAYRRSRACASLVVEAKNLGDDICASVAFMLVGRSLVGHKPTGSLWFQARPPLLLGGFNLQWPLFTISILEIIESDTREHMKKILNWIGTNLGVGQATVLAHMEQNVRGGLIAKGDALKWSGFLL